MNKNIPDESLLKLDITDVTILATRLFTKHWGDQMSSSVNSFKVLLFAFGHQEPRL